MEQHLQKNEISEEEAAMPLGRQEAEAPRIAVWKRFPGAVAMDRWVAKVEDWLNVAGVILIAVMGSVTVVAVIGRYVFRWALRGQVDITEILMAGIVFLGLAFTLRVGGHIRIEFFVGMLKGRFYHLSEFSTLLLSLFLFAVTFISSLRFTIDAWVVGDITGEVYLPTWPAKLCIAIGSLLICLRLVIMLIQHMSQAIAGIERKEL